MRSTSASLDKFGAACAGVVQSPSGTLRKIHCSAGVNDAMINILLYSDASCHHLIHCDRHHTTPTMTRDEALTIVHEYTASDSLRKHMLAVDAAMRAYAERWDEDQARWGL